MKADYFVLNCISYHTGMALCGAHNSANSPLKFTQALEISQPEDPPLNVDALQNFMSSSLDHIPPLCKVA